MIVFPLSYTYPLLLENEGSALKTFGLHTAVYTCIIALFQGAWAKVQVLSNFNVYKHYSKVFLILG